MMFVSLGTSVTGTTHPPGALEFTPVLVGFLVSQYLYISELCFLYYCPFSLVIVLSVFFFGHCIVVFFFGHCIVWSLYCLFFFGQYCTVCPFSLVIVLSVFFFGHCIVCLFLWSLYCLSFSLVIVLSELCFFYITVLFLWSLYCLSFSLVIVLSVFFFGHCIWSFVE